ncbi:hypothetical protein C5E45_27305 [Nocardia nova]|uniref:Uncharacterized protein n=1 Tax=Nocardia nova TaxID=37330 RepID=A0A2S6AIV7_9NOCA|nr:hypothetical protein [Nocardia nova]PPJ31619.1 hypothetical protein C5E41_06835 [Nocardia nova]PPJ35158.1 hypothetical protein C5E45_27305 [Nocardia nova]
MPVYVPGPDPGNPDEGASSLVDLTKVSPVPASNGERLDPVTVPQITAATDAAAAAATSASEADAARDAAQAAVDSFTLAVGTITTGASDAPASLTVSGGPPHWVVDGVLPKGDTGEQGRPHRMPRRVSRAS